ncbi:unnamed protein product [Ophioblennius macclurei]
MDNSTDGFRSELV